jgi:hypothetical protein
MARVSGAERDANNVVRLSSGVLTTHYIAIQETPTDNKVFVLYDLGGWSNGMPRDIYGRFVSITAPQGRRPIFSVEGN